MLVEIIRFFRGYVDFTASGKFPERFLNITSRYGVNLWNATPIKNGIEASMYIGDYRKIRKIAKKSKVKTKISQKHGMPFFAKKYKCRIGIPIGAVVGLALMIVLSNFVWSINICGAENISETQLKSVLADNGVSVGCYKNNLDVQQIERAVLLKEKRVGWMSINITGSVITVELKEKIDKPKINTNPIPCNIKASADGVITKINAKKGTTIIPIGSGVAKGDLIVSGISETKLNTVSSIRAEAEVFANVNSEKELSLPCKYEYSYLSDDKTERKRANFLWLDIPVSINFGSFENSLFQSKKENVFINNNTLPIGINTETELKLIRENTKLNDKIAKSSFNNELMLYEAFEKENSRLIDKKIKVNKKGDNYVCNVQYTFNEDIAQSVEFSVTE